VLTDPGIQFTNGQQAQDACNHIVARVSEEHAIAHRRTTTHHPRTNGQVERMNRTLKEATVTTYDDQTHQRLKEHLHACLMADNCAKRLKTLRELTPDEYLCHCWQKEPKRFTSNPYHPTVGLNN
jgi:transposase